VTTTAPSARTTDASTATTRNALIIAGAVAVIAIARVLVVTIVNFIGLIADGMLSSFESPADFGLYFGPTISLEARTIFAWILPVAIGVFISLRAIRPIAASMSTRTVIVRGLISAAVGAIAGIIVSLPLSLEPAEVANGETLAALSPFPILSALIFCLYRALAIAPLVLLAVVVGWQWLRRTPAV